MKGLKKKQKKRTKAKTLENKNDYLKDEIEKF